MVAGEHDLANELTELTHVGGPLAGSVLPLSYDDAGNLTAKQLTDGSVSGSGGTSSSIIYVHDAWNRLVKVRVRKVTSSTDVTEDRAEYGYNGLHQRVTKKADVTTIGGTAGVPDGAYDQLRVMYYDASWRLVEERIDDNWTPPGSSSTIDRHMLYVWGARGVDDICFRLDNRNLSNDSPTVTYNNVWYHLTDCQGSTVAVTDSTAKLVERLAYDAYGGARHQPKADLNGDGATTTGSGGEVNAIRTLGLANSGAGTPITASTYNPDADLNRDGTITSADYTLAQAAPGSGTGGVTTAAAPGMLNHASSGSGVLPGGGGHRQHCGVLRVPVQRRGAGGRDVHGAVPELRPEHRTMAGA